MSDMQQAPDWWLASDGKWYPPARVGSPPPLNYVTPEQARLRKRQEKLRRRVQRHLEPGEQLLWVFDAQTGPCPDHSVVSLFATVLGVEDLRTGGEVTVYWVVAVTDRNILICPSTPPGPLAKTKMGSKATRIRRVPFEVPEAAGKSYFPITIGRLLLWVGSDQFAIVTAANGSLRAEQGAAATAAPEPTVAAPGQVPAAAPANWYPDPMGRHQMRYWDGQTWTAFVADQGIQSNDPI